MNAAGVEKASGVARTRNTAKTPNGGRMSDPVVIEGVAYDPVLDSHARGIRTADGEYVYIEELLHEGERVRVTIEVLADVSNQESEPSS
jgi:hypothetical protein